MKKKMVLATRSDDRKGVAATVARYARKKGAKTVSSYGVGGFGVYTSVDVLDVKDTERFLNGYAEYFKANSIEARLVDGSKKLYEYSLGIPDTDSRGPLVLDRIEALGGNLISHGCYSLDPAADSGYVESRITVLVDCFTSEDDQAFRFSVTNDMAIEVLTAREVGILDSARRLMAYALSHF